MDKFDEEISYELIEMSALNRDIQQKLKPRFELRKCEDSYEYSLANFNLAVQEKEDITQFNSKDNQNVEGCPLITLQSENFSDKNEDAKLTDIFKRDDTLQRSRGNSSKTNFQRVVNFDPDAPIAECFKSVLKTYRIMKPDTIILENKELEDHHLIELVDFLADKEMVKTLNLRKNNISNDGASALADFILNKDDSLKEVNLNRNRIENEGIESLLDAVHGTIRFQSFGISFGNFVSAT